MSKAKANNIKNLLKIPRAQRGLALTYAEPIEIHAKAHGLAFLVHYTKDALDNNWPDKAKCQREYDEAVSQFKERCLQGLLKQDVKFFRALADVVEGPNPQWNNLERFVHRLCSMAEGLKVPLPTASQIEKAYNSDGTNGPRQHQLEHGPTIGEIQRAAEHVGYELPRQKPGGDYPPAGKYLAAHVRKFFASKPTLTTK